MSDISDEALVVKVQGGDTESFGFLVDRYEAKMLRYARKFLFGHDDAPDVVQEVFIKAFSNIQSFNTSLKFSSWLYRIAHNEFINAIKKRGRESVMFVDLDLVFPHLSSHEAADDNLKREEMQKMLNFCLDQIDPKYREPLVLYYFEELSYQEMADILHIPVSTVGVRLRRGREAFEKVYRGVEKKYE